ncbi:OLC1v1021104C1 [Oldenlandia corymbosa var. corymbosa]|uniref:OLC1v1021104C1 n=1 Tax=Oldenlandia corymbosa var. corymbosa TaxID=529605 RepID=A0AAV1BWF1_OLDCO|nr:OLC1v1021104C1 [Oldenlandia corymbosa var. corymbosa]
MAQYPRLYDIRPVTPWVNIGIGLPLQIQPGDPNNNKLNHINNNNYAATTTSGGGSREGGRAGGEMECTVREQDRFMPIANVIRIMRKILPAHAKISDDAKETIQECVSEFISFITGEANERCQKEQRKTITAEDVLWAMSKFGFDDYIEPLTLYLHRHREFDAAAPGDHHQMGGSTEGFEVLLGKRAVAASVEHHLPALGTGIALPGTPTTTTTTTGPPLAMHSFQHRHPEALEFFTPSPFPPPPPHPAAPVNGFLSGNNKINNNHSSSFKLNGGALVGARAEPSSPSSVVSVDNEDQH